MCRYCKYITKSNLLFLFLGLIFSCILSVTGCVSGKINPSPQSKPIPPQKSNLPSRIDPGGTPGTSSESSAISKDIIAQADIYAGAVANGNWVTAKNMSTEANKLLLDHQIKPQLTAYWRKWKIKLPSKSTAIFEDSQLIKASYDNQLVIERLEYASQQGTNKALYLQFQITLVGDKYLINDTLLLSTAKIIPGA